MANADLVAAPGQFVDTAPDQFVDTTPNHATQH